MKAAAGTGLGVLALLLSAVVGVALLAAAAVILLVTPQYRAEVLLLIESDGAPRIVTLECVVSSLSGDEESVRSQAHILASRSLTARGLRLPAARCDARARISTVADS